MTTFLPRGFLKKIGFDFEKSPAALDKAFLKSFEASGRQEVEATWSLLRTGATTERSLYALPKSEKQASLLFSHDRERVATSLEWFANVVETHNPKSIVEMGCGAGFLLRYLRALDAEVVLCGVDQQSNLMKTIPEGDRIETLVGDYRSLSSDRSFDLIICDFGWDNADIPASKTPHSVSELEGQKYCPGCSDDASLFFQDLLRACERWGHEKSRIALTGRLTNMGMIRAVFLAAERLGRHVGEGCFSVRKSRIDKRNVERFPSFVFSREMGGAMSLHDIAEAYGDP
ncbi:bifunctional 2-polyprenyl-6-hydroxyphenol methylase/3-demethylubiquinol 3-O-methyltransferase UbiG [Rhizobium sp. L1K21]|uniref:class I SAM-dependent methyltransferase n=1 Tax=Rhizobium sp. L1K21 TaxID=2954933 RepID=UPI0020924715|nr:class I SAM-dependent methyltransferase [Rhizobium sp. L1K21]MCO6184598.1 class I SAM-dependent methyltransferase [Rhizobium sp. L1K21]